MEQFGEHETLTVFLETLSILHGRSVNPPLLSCSRAMGSEGVAALLL